MSKAMELQGTIVEVLGNNNYKVKVNSDMNVPDILCHLSGKMRQFKINVIVGDEVTLEAPPPFDKGRITFRGFK